MNTNSDYKKISNISNNKTSDNKNVSDDKNKAIKNLAVIFAGGSGQRMHAKDRPKQFLFVHGKPIIVHTVEIFNRHPEIDGIIVVCIKDSHSADPRRCPSPDRRRSHHGKPSLCREEWHQYQQRACQGNSRSRQ